MTAERAATERLDVADLCGADPRDGLFIAAPNARSADAAPALLSRQIVSFGRWRLLARHKRSNPWKRHACSLKGRGAEGSRLSVAWYHYS